MTKEEIKQRAAIAVLPECVRETHEVLSNGGKLIEETQAKQAAMMAVAYADELAEKLSNVSENGKNSKPANFAKNCKDLQELTEFEMALQATIIGFVLPKKKPSVEDVKYWAKELMNIAYKQFERAQLNPKLEEYEQLFQHFNAAVNDEIKRRCAAINANEMAAWIENYKRRDAYAMGVEDTIKKLKGE